MFPRPYIGLTRQAESVADSRGWCPRTLPVAFTIRTLRMSRGSLAQVVWLEWLGEYFLALFISDTSLSDHLDWSRVGNLYVLVAHTFYG
jgi:hypothetical protein